MKLNLSGQNIVAEEIDGRLVLSIDLSAPTTLSSTGKTQIVASTRGNKPVAVSDGKRILNIGVNVYEK